MAEPTKTRQELVNRALKVIGQIEAGEAPAIEDYTTIDELVDPLLAQLATDKIVYIGDSENIEMAYFLPLARLLANMAGPDFGSPINEEAKFRDERMLRRLGATRVSQSDTIKAVYF